MKAWFSSAEPETLSSTTNTGTGTVSATIVQTSDLKASDYLLRWNGAQFDVTRRSDGALTSSGSPITIDGLELTLSGTPAVNDTFLVSATGHAAGRFESEIERTDELALAATLVATNAVGNAGDATLAQPVVVSSTAANLGNAVDITFTSDNTFDVIDRSNPASPVPIATGVAYTPGANIAYNGWSTSLSGKAAAGDTHSIELNDDGSGDNSNALALVALQNERSVGGTATVSDEQADLVSFVGGRKRTLDTRATRARDAARRGQSTRRVRLRRQPRRGGDRADQVRAGLPGGGAGNRRGRHPLPEHPRSRTTMITPRITSNESSRQVAADIRRQQVAIAEVREQLSSGKRINRPSDDPVARRPARRHGGCE